ncbi:E3 ubiquitin-protein ligase FANCL isoform X5 [Columba livia]|uniref:E3 ubiquitin-protein ligase FANCL isoform X5 n=1 Tax=Columba livia TaxID=8932 RepID=UPI0031BB6436
MAGARAALLRQCPLLLPLNREGTAYEGFVTAQRLPYQDTVTNGFATKKCKEIALRNTQDLHIPRPPEYYSCLVRDLETLGWNKVVYVDTGLTTVKLKAEDSCGRQHLIILKLNSKYPTEPPDCLVDFPVQFAVSWMPQNSLIDIYNQFLVALESLKEFWDAMDEIDGKTWVLEPENPTRSATTRRIAIVEISLNPFKTPFKKVNISVLKYMSAEKSLYFLTTGNNVSVNIEVDPRHPNMLPECYFLGADHAVNPLRIKLNNNMHSWDPEISLLQNLQDLLEIDFPSRAVLEKSDFAKDCGICYAYRLAGAPPDQVCDDPRCGQPFHQACLYEWLQGLPSSRQSFNVIFGECPYCNKPLTLKSSVKKL